MKALVVGGGGREHALAWGLSKSPAVKELWTTSKNAGIDQLACFAGRIDGSASELADWAELEGIDLTVVGPEAALAEGIVDEFRTRGLAIVGPTRKAAELESSKAFAKELMVRAAIPTARFEVCSSAAHARRVVRRLGAPVVVKADGLAAGKGVTVCPTIAEADACIAAIMEDRLFGDAGERVVIEECLFGTEVSVLAFVSGKDVIVMPTSQDHKAARDGDQGPNTGGMGAYSPVPGLGKSFLNEIRETVMLPTIREMAAMDRAYSGVLYAGLMLTDRGPQVLEFNCRFGDPETQVLVPRLESDLFEILSAVANDRLQEVEVCWSDQAAVCVVMASAGYPGEYDVGLPINGLMDVAQEPSVQVFHSGTRKHDQQIVTAGGRVLGVTAWADELAAAVQKAYSAVGGKIHFRGAHFRRDIAQKALT